MKYLIASDIHGSAYYCSQMLDQFNTLHCDRLILLGDILYHGPRNDLPKEYSPKEVISLLNPYAPKILCIRGNCDCEVDQMVLDFPILADYAVLDCEGQLIYLTHGHKDDVLQNLLKNTPAVILHGHTHVPKHEKLGELSLWNPGSISLPKENSPHSFLVLENGIFTFHSLTD